MLLKFDHKNKKVCLSLRGAEVLDQLEKAEIETLKTEPTVDTLWRPEYARYMLEATPGVPYGLKVNELINVEANMKLRRKICNQYLEKDEYLVSMCSFPRLGCVEDSKTTFLYPEIDFSDADHVNASNSLFVPDEIISPHPRFKTLTKNIRLRRTEKVAINVPVYHDKLTKWPFVDDFCSECYTDEGPALQNHVYMDAMCFGMGCCCLQITLQATKESEARHLYDQLAVLTPILLSLSAASPVFRGVLSDVDCRWNVIAASVDDRSRVERGIHPPYQMPVDRWDGKKFVPTNFEQRRIPKSRYDSISTYLSPEAHIYNDLDLVVDQDICLELAKQEIDPYLARHLAHLFIRDPLVIYRESLLQDDAKDMDHFENIQSTNWQTMRFKPPVIDKDLGWRVEFRAMEVQLTDFENAAYSVFTLLLSRLILCFDLQLYLPLSLVDKNMKTAQGRDSILKGQFWFRKSLTQHSEKEISPCSFAEKCCPIVRRSYKASTVSDNISNDDEDIIQIDNNVASNVSEQWSLFSMNEIINGSSEQRGIVPLLREFLDNLKIEPNVRKIVDEYISFISDRAAGKIATAANWIRSQVMNHSKYKSDSIVTSEINYDLMVAIKKLEESGFPMVSPTKFQ